MLGQCFGTLILDEAPWSLLPVLCINSFPLLLLVLGMVNFWRSFPIGVCVAGATLLPPAAACSCWCLHMRMHTSALPPSGCSCGCCLIPQQKRLARSSHRVTRAAGCRSWSCWGRASGMCATCHHATACRKAMWPAWPSRHSPSSRACMRKGMACLPAWLCDLQYSGCWGHHCCD